MIPSFPPHAAGLRVGLYGGSFNPPHEGHRHVALLALRRIRDFYTLSDCRDLLFHVQEHRLTLPMIKAALQKLDLDFLGFEMDEGVFAHFRDRFPEAKTLDDLDLWQVFETENPDTFTAMYQFWTQKREADRG